MRWISSKTWLAFLVLCSAPSVAQAASDGTVDLVPIAVDVNVAQLTVQYTVTVENQGTGTSPGFFIDVVSDSTSAPQPGDHGYPMAEVDGLLPGEQRVVVLPDVAKKEGSYLSWIIVDAANAVPEWDESNNVMGPTEALVAPTALMPMPDIFVANTTATIQNDGSVKYAIEFHNGGGLDISTDFRVQVYWDSATQPPFGSLPGPNEGKNFDFWSSNGGWLQSGASKTVNFTWDAPSASVHRTWILVDSDQSLTESDVNNNVFGPFVVDMAPAAPLPDLAVTGASAEVNGYTITYEVGITNNGSVAPGPFRVHVFAGGDSAPAPHEGEFAQATASFDVGPGPGDTISHEVIWPEGYPGADIPTWLVVDAYQDITESNETNNTFGPVPVTIESIGGPDIGISEFTASMLNGNAQYSISLVNDGDVATGAFEVHLFHDLLTAPTDDDAADEVIQVSDLAPGAAPITLNAQWAAVPQGSHQSWIIADRNEVVAETKEANNIAASNGFVVDQAICPDGFFSSACQCGGAMQEIGYCCDGAFQQLPCSTPSPIVDAGETTGSDIEDIESGEESGVIVDAPPADSGCRTPHTPLGPPFVLLALVALIISARTRRDT
jgi:hypothetical protein